MAAFLDNVRFNPTAGGTTDWTYSSAVTGYQSPSAAGVVNSTKYKYFATSADASQWEIGEGAYNTSTGVLPRTTVLFNSSGTTSKINFSVAPTVAIVALAEDMISVEQANSFTATQQLQARTNIGASGTTKTRTVFTSGSGTYSTPANCKSINVTLLGGGGQGGGGTNASGGSTGGNGGTTTFGTTFLTANGGSGGGPGIGSGGAGGSASGGDINMTGPTGSNGGGSGFGATTNMPGGHGGCSKFGGNGFGGTPGGAGGAGISGSGSGGGGGGGTTSGNGGGGGGGGAGGYCEKLISSPSASYSYGVGAGGSGGGAASSTGGAGGNGGSGIIIIDEFY